MKLRTLAVPAVLVAALGGCAPASDVESSPSATEAAPSVAPAPEGDPLVIPENCDDLVSMNTIHTQFDTSFVAEPFVLHAEDSVGQSFADRGGINCAWILPQSDGFVTLHIAEREAGSDEEQVAAWQTAGLPECPPFLDACFYKEEETMVGAMLTSYALVDGFEVRAISSAGPLDALLELTREAVTNMGYR